MRNILKIFALLMMLALICVSLISCGGGSGAGTSDDKNGGEVLSSDEIQTIVLERVPGASAEHITEMESEYDDGKYEYEGSIHYDGYKYEFEVDGETGNILSWEIDD